MCELFALSADHSVDITERLRRFYSHSDNHPHGYGLALFARDGAPVLMREPVPASHSGKLRAFLDNGVAAKDAIGHIRYATIGQVEDFNCHPFVARSMSGRYGVLAHNGTIFNYPQLSIYYEKQLGETDSERVLLRLMDLLLQEERGLGREATADERFRLWEEEFARMAKGNKLNVLFHYADTLYIHTNMEKSLYMLEGGGQCVFATVSLDGSEWKPVPLMRLLAYRDGKLTACGHCHGHRYVENKEDLKYLYMAYAGL